MKTLQSSLTWFFRQKLSGKLFIGCSGLFTLFCLCGFLSAILSPSNPTFEAVASTPDVSSIRTSAAETFFAGITQTAISNPPTQTFTPPAEPTFSAEPSLTATFVPTSTSDQLGWWVFTPGLPVTSGDNGNNGGGSNCNPSYPDICLQDGIGDYDCAGGSGNGPNYIEGQFRVLPPDPFELDRDKDGIGCNVQ